MVTVKEYFSECEEKLYNERLHIRRCVLFLRRKGIDTMEDLLKEDETTLIKIRGLNTKSVELIMEVCGQYKHSLCTGEEKAEDSLEK